MTAREEQGTPTTGCREAAIEHCAGCRVPRVGIALGSSLLSGTLRMTLFLYDLEGIRGVPGGVPEGVLRAKLLKTAQNC